MHKVRATGAIPLACILLLWPAFAEAQTQSPQLAFRVRDGIWLAIGTALYATPHIFSMNHGPPPCSPCDAAAVPWFDRWAISQPGPGWDAASTVTLGALGALTLADLLLHYRKVEPPSPSVKLVQSAALALGTVELSKALAARNRPVLYTDQALQYGHRLDSRRSWPSGHSAAAAALATNYLLNSGAAEPVGHGWRSWAAGGAAAAVGIMRVAAGRHFPSDVLGGFAVGVLSAIAVHRIEF